MRIIQSTPESLESLQEWYKDIPPSLPITAVQGYTYVVSYDDLQQWVKENYPGRKQEFNEAVGVVTAIEQGIYLTDINSAIRRMNGKPTLWD